MHFWMTQLQMHSLTQKHLRSQNTNNRQLSQTSKDKLMLSRDLRLERSLSSSLSTLQSNLLRVFPEPSLGKMVEFLGNIIEREEEPGEEDLKEFENRFRKELSQAKASDIVGLYKVLHLKVELKKCKERVRDLVKKVVV
jgi:uncharacterized protein YPO0396